VSAEGRQLLSNADDRCGGRMLWFNEDRGDGQLVTDDGERIAVDRNSFTDGAAPVGRCGQRPVQLTLTELDGQRAATNVTLVQEVAPRRARRHRSGAG
jgi:hypothetical protein